MPDSTDIRADYDPEADALYIRIAAGDVARTVEHDHANIVDLDADANVLGIEVLSPRRNARLDILAAGYGFADRLGEVERAVAAVLPATAVGEHHRLGLTFASAGYIGGATAAAVTLASGTFTFGEKSREQDVDVIEAEPV